MTNIRQYIGIPYKKGSCGLNGCNCWGLVRIFYKQEFNVHLPPLEKEEFKGPDVIAMHVKDQEKKSWKLAKKPLFGDVIVFNIAGKPRHVAIFLNDAEMLHIENGKDSCVEDLKSSNWPNLFEGLYRYVG